ncbi:DnaJ homolog subfamily B member 12 [Durusdinium trenchii]|uniref:DnaJ homolog subfamily B member 12 n=1 Tax=Durusdinium trenchii TaxID=1381693 RepID=A0ABP0IB80_9DINO
MREGRVKQSLDFYGLLGVGRAASAAELRQAYRRRALQTHPDKGGCAEAFRRVLHAFEVLSSGKGRAKYDLDCAARKPHRTPNAPKAPCRPRGRSGSSAQSARGTPRGQSSQSACAGEAQRPSVKMKKMTKSLVRLRSLATHMEPEQRREAISGVSAALKERLLDFMTTYGKTGLPPPDLPVSAAKTDTATDGSDPQNCRLGARKAALSGECSSSSSEEGDDLGDSDELDELPQHAAPLGRAARAVVLAPLALENEDDEENEIAEDPEPRKRPRLSKKPSRGCTGLRGVSRRLDTKTRRKSYQASVRFENLSFRSKYSGDIQMALDHHITLMRIRSEVESLVELEGHTFDEACHKACAARQAELKEMNVSYYVDLRAFGGKVASPSTCCLEEVLNDRARLLRAREAGVLNFQEELVRVMTAKRTNVYKLRRRPSVEKAQRFAEKIWEEACERKRESENRREEIQEKRRSKREALHVRQRERQQRRRLALWQRWQKAAPRAERQLAREQQVQEKILQNHLARELKAMRAEDAVQQKLRSAHRKVELGHRWQRSGTFDISPSHSNKRSVDPGAFRLAYDTENISNYLEAETGGRETGRRR